MRLAILHEIYHKFQQEISNIGGIMDSAIKTEQNCEADVSATSAVKPENNTTISRYISNVCLTKFYGHF